MTQKGYTFPADYTYLEMYFLEMEIQQYVTRTDMANVKQIFKLMDEEDLSFLIEGNMVGSTQNFNDTEVSWTYINLQFRVDVNTNVNTVF